MIHYKHCGNCKHDGRISKVTVGSSCNGCCNLMQQVHYFQRQYPSVQYNKYGKGMNRITLHNLSGLHHDHVKCRLNKYNVSLLCVTKHSKCIEHDACTLMVCRICLTVLILLLLISPLMTNETIQYIC